MRHIGFHLNSNDDALTIGETESGKVSVIYWIQMSLRIRDFKPEL